MIIWDRVANRLDARYAYQGGPFASVYEDGGKWFVRWWVGPVGVHEAPSEAKARQWVERYARTRLKALGGDAASPGVGPYRTRQDAPVNTPEQQARYDEFSAKYVAPKRARKRRR